MKNKIKDYIDLIFADAPDCAKTREMKEEMYSNVSDRYDDLIKEGKSPATAYNISVSGIGDISEIIDSLKAEKENEYKNPYSSAEYSGKRKEEKKEYKNPYSKSYAEREFTEKEKAEIEKYRMRRGIMNSVAIALYILCWVPLVALSVIIESMGGNSDIAATVGICIMMVMVAVATVLMVMKSGLKPICLRGIKDSEFDDDDDDDKPRKGKGRKNPALIAINGAVWTLTIVSYFIISFLSGAWHLTWLMFLIAAAVENIIAAIFEICGKKYL